MVKKILAIILTFSLILSATTLGYADDSKHTAIFVVGQSSYIQDNLSKSMDAATFIQNGRTYVPLRYLGLALGVNENDIQWDSASQTATLSMNGTTLKFTIGKTTYYTNNQANSMDVAPLVKNGRTYLPARYVAEAFGYKVNWNGDTQAVTVYTDVTPQAPPDKWGFPLKATKADLKAGSQYAQITDINGNTYSLDLGQKVLLISNPKYIQEYLDRNPGVYPEGSYYVTDKFDNVALYVPFIPLAEAFGVPKENIEWDGQHLTIYGWDGSKDGYLMLTANSTDEVEKWHDGSTTTSKDYLNGMPLLVVNGVPMIGITNSENFGYVVFDNEGAYCSIIKAFESIASGGNVADGTIEINVAPATIYNRS
ncbi:copper amine oxidase N-terminal domain-containing protein [Thermoanaerobacterium thermosaccharolyticum]|uniref:copper amine oxidase N-terminal domain-containing protein n=1 Tax=Thermoanaerobacterium thermosaccharolyticum TaxID=1517 RepID=UPI003D286BE9